MGTQPRQQVRCALCAGWGERQTKPGLRWLLGERLRCPACKGEGWVFAPRPARQWTPEPPAPNVRPPAGGSGQSRRDH